MPRFRIMATTYRSHRHQVDIRNSNSSWLLTAESGRTLTLRVVTFGLSTVAINKAT